MRNTLHFVLLFVITSFLISCGALVTSKAHQRATVEGGALPKDFGKHQGTLLCVTYTNGYNRYLKRNLKKVYDGPYELVSTAQLNAPPYNDIEQYPYVFDFTYKENGNWNFNSVAVGPNPRFRVSKVKVFHLTDRIADEQFSLNMTSGYWSKLQRAYLKKMAEQRRRTIEPDSAEPQP